MLRAFLLTLVVSFGFTTASWAVEPTPKSEVKEKTSSPQSPASGAITVEKKTAVPADSLKKENTGPEVAPAQPVTEPPPAETPKKKSESTASSHSSSHLFGLHASVGLPHPINYGLNYVHSSHLFSAEISTGSYGLTVDSTDVKIFNTEFALRWHPWAGSFYLGALVGQQRITAKKTSFVTNGGTSANVTGEAEVKSNYVTPHLGWIWGLEDGGLFVSFDLGVQSPSGVTTSFTSDVPAVLQSQSDYVKLESDVRDQGEKVGKLTLPYVGLLKIGWLF